VTADVEEAEWVRRSRSGDAGAFGRLVERYQSRLLNAVTRTVGRQVEAEDIVQEAFVRAFQAIDRFRQHSTFYTWLYRIAFNLVASTHRQRRHLANPGETVPVEELEADETTNPEAHAEANEQRHRVQQAISELPETFRLPLVLRDVEGMNYGEIGEVLGVPIGTVKSRIHRARLDLRDKLKDLL
jgi:RNA polymerase sigma-70 factor (ECF subfamily)